MVYGNYISIRDLWAGFNPDGVAKGIFVLFRGYMDESYDKERKLFCLSCLIGDGAQWIRLCREWKEYLIASTRG